MGKSSGRKVSSTALQKSKWTITMSCGFSEAFGRVIRTFGQYEVPGDTCGMSKEMRQRSCFASVFGHLWGDVLDEHSQSQCLPTNSIQELHCLYLIVIQISAFPGLTSVNCLHYLFSQTFLSSRVFGKKAQGATECRGGCVGGGEHE